jgi:hypothetical protein
MTPDEKKLDALEAAFHDAALADAEADDATPEEKEWAKQFHARVDAQLADMEKNLAPSAAPAKPIRPSLLALTRDALLAKLEQLVSVGRLQVAHRKLSTLSDDDLRRLIQSATSDAE